MKMQTFSPSLINSDSFAPWAFRLSAAPAISGSVNWGQGRGWASGNSQDGAGGGEKCPSPGMRASPLAVWAAAPFEPSSLQLQLHTQAQLPRDGLELRDSKPRAPAHRALIALTHKAGWPPCLSPRTIESCSHGLFSDLGQGLGPLLWPQSALSWLHCSVEPHVAPSVLPCPCVIHLEATLVRLPCS